MTIQQLFLDLDGTLYTNKNGMWNEIAQRMEAYLHEVIGIPLEKVPETRLSYFLEYGTTLSGLMANHEVDPNHFLAYVHDVPVANYLKPDERLRRILTEIPQPKWILTNSDTPHATRVLKTLELFDLFEDILDITRMEFLNKPNPIVFQKALAFAGNPTPERCVFVDDIPHNLTPAKEQGMVTVLVGEKPDNGFSDYQIPDIYALGDVLEKIANG
jgi:putative hydrolase of the HAD superfamily